MLREKDDDSLQEDLETCKHFLAVSENGRHRIVNFAMDALNPHLLMGMLDLVLYNLTCAAKSNVVLVFSQKLEEWYWSLLFCTQETRMVQPKFVSAKCFAKDQELAEQC